MGEVSKLRLEHFKKREVEKDHDTKTPRHHDTRTPRHHDTRAPRHHDTRTPRHHDTRTLRHPARARLSLGKTHVEFSLSCLRYLPYTPL